jgi:hypothetical protein
MNVGLVLRRRISGRHRHLRWRQLVDHVWRMRRVGHRWLFNHACDNCNMIAVISKIRRATGAPAGAERGVGAPRAKAWGGRGGEAPRTNS